MPETLVHAAVQEYRSKVKTPKEMVEFIQSKRKPGLSGYTFVTTNGCFDILHPGHIAYLAEASTLGTYLVVALNTDRSVERLKGSGRPINPLEDRVDMLAGLGFVDFITYFFESTPCDLLAQLQPDIHVKGGDYRTKPMPETPVVEAYGGRVEFIDLLPGYSTSKIIEKIRYSLGAPISG